MSREYKKRSSARQSSSFSKQLLLVLVCFLVGYLSASVFDFATVSSWVNAQLIAQHVTTKAEKTVSQQRPLPKPKFEFYTLLASEHPDASADTAKAAPVKAIQAVTPSPTTPTTVPTTTVALATAKNPTMPAPVVNAVPVKPLPAYDVNHVVNNKDAYLVQVAAFKSQQEADRMKAALVLKGFVVNISMVSQQKTNWYRVSIGPFESRLQAQKAQGAVARSEHIVGMIRKMDA